jgi:PPOX class probable F420-dependent enzyme
MPGAFDQFVNQRTVLLTTYRRDGSPVGTLVNIVVAGDRAFVRTFDTAWKLKRIRNNPTVGIAPSTVRGKPTGPTIGARARVLDGRNKTGSIKRGQRTILFSQQETNGRLLLLFWQLDTRLNAGSDQVKFLI